MYWVIVCSHSSLVFRREPPKGGASRQVCVVTMSEYFMGIDDVLVLGPGKRAGDCDAGKAETENF